MAHDLQALRGNLNAEIGRLGQEIERSELLVAGLKKHRRVLEAIRDSIDPSCR